MVVSIYFDIIASYDWFQNVTKYCNLKLYKKNTFYELTYCNGCEYFSN